MQRAILVLFLSAPIVTGCGHDAPIRTPASAPPPRASARLPGSGEKSPQSGVVHISADIRKACGISDSDAHFAFDSAALQQPEMPVLTQLAHCFVAGPLASKDMRLVGHADPRGDSDYNMVLGGSRADTVKTFLTIRGVPAERIGTTSRGEIDAAGTNEATWAEDRRVDVVSR